MRLDGRRESDNFEDRRGMSGGTKAGMGIGGIILIGIITLLMGGNMSDVISNVGQQMAQVQEATPEAVEREFTEEEQAQAKFCRQVLASTEDVWTAVFQKMGRTYTPLTVYRVPVAELQQPWDHFTVLVTKNCILTYRSSHRWRSS